MAVPMADQTVQLPSVATAGVADLRLEIAAGSDVGCVRTQNEDAVQWHIPEDAAELEAKGILCVVADGMGGHQAGEVASQLAVAKVTELYYGDASPEAGTRLTHAVRAANDAIYTEAQSDLGKAGMGSTLVAVAILGPKVVVANVGDSRAYLVEKTAISQITDDHSWVEEQVRAGLLSREQADSHPHRNLVTRALGSRPSVEVDLFEGTMREGEQLLLCSDGLTTHLSDREIHRIARQHAPDEAATLLVEAAKTAGGNDNVSVLIVGWSSTGTPARKVRAPGAGLNAPAGEPAGALTAVRVLAGAGVLLWLLGLAALVLPPLLGLTRAGP